MKYDKMNRNTDNEYRNNAFKMASRVEKAYSEIRILNADMIGRGGLPELNKLDKKLETAKKSLSDAWQILHSIATRIRD